MGAEVAMVTRVMPSSHDMIILYLGSAAAANSLRRII